jgi:glucose-fructose oxidoreductase
MHMGDNLRMAWQHPQCEIAGICDADPSRLSDAAKQFGLRDDQLFDDWHRCLDLAQPDLIILCPATADHGAWVEQLAPRSVPLLVEKPMASSLQDADRMMAACEAAGTLLAINWPLYWVASHRTAKRAIDEGMIGDLIEVHFYDGNRGPLYHTADKRKVSDQEVLRQKPTSWFYQADRGGGSLLDYLGYGATLATWFLNGQAPLEVTCVVDQPAGLQVDEHSVTVARYSMGLSKFETRWGTFSDPWIHQPQPTCGFVLVGTDGTISSYDYADSIRIQTREQPQGFALPVDQLRPPAQNPIQCMVHCIENGLAPPGPLSPEISRIGQQIVDTAFASAQQKRTLPLLS